MELITYITIWVSLSGLFTIFLVVNNPYIRAHKLAQLTAEQIEILKHKWLESEKVGHDIGIKNAKKSWSKYHAKKWKESRR
tara:strand:+ start:256 stop:498 length:243 start_codon:yes stop_codon:yes gene_type:complete